LRLFEEALIHLPKGSLPKSLDKHQILSVDFHEVLNATASASELVVWIQLSHDQSVACSQTIATIQFASHKTHPVALVLCVKAHAEEPNDCSQHNAANDEKEDIDHWNLSLTGNIHIHKLSIRAIAIDVGHVLRDSEAEAVGVRTLALSVVLAG